jgi:ABC-type Fe3+ transport system permease subunit
VENRTSRREKIQTIVTVLMAAVIAAFLAGLLGHALRRDAVEWGAWTFTTVATLGVGICGVLWATETS